jgi:preprotein translocase subunit SecA
MVIEDAQAAYDRRKQELTREIKRRVVLSVLDRKWRGHLYEMDYLRENIGLQAMGQRDPLGEYQRKAYDMFTAMMVASRRSRSGTCSICSSRSSRTRSRRKPTPGRPRSPGTHEASQ